MASYKIFLLTIAYVLTIVLCAPSEQLDKDDLIAEDKEDLQTAASHWGGFGHYGGYGGYGGYYPGGYGGYWGYPTYGYGYGYGWPYGGYYGHHGYWW